jgi:hypothetical protein
MGGSVQADTLSFVRAAKATLRARNIYETTRSDSLDQNERALFLLLDAFAEKCAYEGNQLVSFSARYGVSRSG